MRRLLLSLWTFLAVALTVSSQEVVSQYGFSCDGCKSSIKLQRFSDSYKICHEMDGVVVSEWPLRYPVYRFFCGDVTGDGFPEIAVGVEKSTRYRKSVDKRLFLFKLYRHRLIRPLWLGSHLGLPLQDFSLVDRREQNKGAAPRKDVLAVLTDEKGHTRRAIYEYKGFGLKFVAFLDE